MQVGPNPHSTESPQLAVDPFLMHDPWTPTVRVLMTSADDL